MTARRSISSGNFYCATRRHSAIYIAYSTTRIIVNNSMNWHYWFVHICALWTLHLALCSKLVLCYCFFFVTMNSQLRWALCLSGNPPLCVSMLSVFTALLLYRGEWTFSLSLSLSFCRRMSVSVRPFAVVSHAASSQQLTPSRSCYYYYYIIITIAWFPEPVDRHWCIVVVLTLGLRLTA